MLNSLKSKVSLVYITLVVIIAILGAVSLFNVHEISKAVDSLIVTNYNSIQRLEDMGDALQAQHTALLRYLYSGDAPRALQTFQAQDTKFWLNCNTEHATIIIPREAELIANIESTYEEFAALFPQALDFGREPEGLRRTYAFYQDEVLPKLGEVHLAINGLISSNETALFQRKTDATQVVRHCAYLLSFLFFLAVVISLFAARMYTNKLFRPIYEITQNLKAVRQGNMNRKSSVKTRDELGVLAAEFNNMTQRLMEFEQSTLGQLLNERNKTLAIMRSINEPMVILDGESRVTLLNDSFERIFGVTTEAATDKHFLEVLAQCGQLPALAGLNYKSRKFSQTMAALSLFGKTRYYNVMVTPLPGQETGPASAIIVFYDVTALKSLDQMRSDFIATISHEFKTPLTSIVMGADLLADRSVGPLTGDQDEIVETLREDSQRLCNLVNDLLELSKIESSNTVYQFQACSINEIVETSLRQFHTLAAQGGIRLITEFAADLPMVSADETKVTWVLNNLLSNAVKYTGPGGTITVRTHSDGDFIRTEVEDTGTGIPAEYLERIFDKYVQVSTYDLELRGSGLGLAVARGIITAHQGKIWCESQLEHGSKFLFTLPVLKEGL